MILQTSKARERICLFGAAGTGKSRAWVSIAKHCPQSHVYVIDTDGTAERMLPSGAENVTVHECYEWDEITAALDAVQALVQPHDWLVVDMIDVVWDACQAHFIERVFGCDWDQYFMERRISAEQERKKAASTMKLDGRHDWGVINRLYRKVAVTLFFRSRCNVFACAPVASIGESEDPATQAMYAHLGVKPKGQKALSHQVHTVLYTKQRRLGQWTMTTVKDRERVQLDDAAVSDFAPDYLVGVAGWQYVANGGEE